jgi:hypothetical protein
MTLLDAQNITSGDINSRSFGSLRVLNSLSGSNGNKYAFCHALAIIEGFAVFFRAY